MKKTSKSSVSGADIFFTDGCGRCPLFSTPQCKVHAWKEELALLRSIALESGLNEELKWGMPCYTHHGANIFMIGAFKEYCSMSFFKGALLKDAKGVLTSPGENSQTVKQARFTTAKDILRQHKTLLTFIREAVDNENAGKKVAFKKITEHQIPEEFQTRLKKDPKLKSAYESLTPGRQRGYLLYFSGAKQSKTRVARIEKCIPLILKGKGLND